ncbi:MAG TPA: Uma2 family endonuclease [Ktedonobacteraceae bacterium]|nr:Uma2 family endonuclease [Ktedonobacteraceae bacterium]
MTTDPQGQYLWQGGPMSVQEYLQLDQSTLDGKYEYVDGVARLMSGGSAGHDRIAYNMRVALDQHFRSGPCTVFGSDVQVLIGTKSNGKEHYVYPDVTISCDVADRHHLNTLIRSPRIVVEVISPSTETFDRSKKLRAYIACATIQEIVLIDQFKQVVEVYRRVEDGTTWNYMLYGPDSLIELISVDVCISMGKVYRGIDFDEMLIEK